MQFTNEQGLSQAWVNALTADDYDKVGDYSVTSIIKSPREYFLMERHAEHIVQDVTERIWMMLGTAIHYVLEKSADDEAITEQRFLVDVGGKQLSCKPDRIELMTTGEDEYCLKDFKVTTVWKYIHKISHEWFWQFNIYSWGARTKLGINVTKCEVEMLMKDWSRTQYLREQNINKKFSNLENGYPDSPIKKKEVKLLGDAEVEAFVNQRITLFNECADMDDKDLPFCTQEERWAKPDYFKVKSIIGGKVSEKALPSAGNFPTRADADAFVIEHKKKSKKKDGTLRKGAPENYKVEFVRGESNKCSTYCKAAPFCNQYRTQVNPAF